MGSTKVFLPKIHYKSNAPTTITKPGYKTGEDMQCVCVCIYIYIYISFFFFFFFFFQKNYFFQVVVYIKSVKII